MLCLRTGRPARRQSADRFDCILYRAAGAAGGPYTRFYRYRAHMAWTGRYLKHRTRSKGPCGAHTAVRSTVRQYTWPMCNSKTVTNRPRRGGGLTQEVLSVPRPYGVAAHPAPDNACVLRTLSTAEKDQTRAYTNHRSRLRYERTCLVLSARGTPGEDERRGSRTG